MAKQFAIALGVLLSLGTAASASFSDAAATGKPAAMTEASAAQLDFEQSAKIVAVWGAHAGSSGSVPLARPL